jgi:hypothetical protein
MNTVQNGKGSKPRNNSSHAWYVNWDAINWYRNKFTDFGRTKHEIHIERKEIKNDRSNDVDSV